MNHFVFDVETANTNKGEIYVNVDSKKGYVYMAVSDGNMFDNQIPMVETKLTVQQVKKIMLLLGDSILQLPPE